MSRATRRANGTNSVRLWPGVVIVVVQWLARFGAPAVWPDTQLYGVVVGMAGGVAVIVWWGFFSRASALDRWGGLALMVGALAATPSLLDESLATAGQGILLFVYVLPTLSLGVVAAAAAGQRLAAGPRRAVMIVAILVSCAGWALVRTGGITGEGRSDFAWRWSPTPEERLLMRAGDVPATPTPAGTPREAGDAPAPTPPAGTPLEAGDAPAAPAPVATPMEPGDPTPAPAAAEWPGFRGRARDGVVRGVRIATDWTSTPPERLWRRPIGPGWSSFAVQGDHFYTQEQRGDDETVACYSVTTGDLVWRHADPTRFWESNGGAGPRSTPTLAEGRVYTLGATGVLNALDAANGAVLWSRNAATDTGVEIPGWGLTSSPLVLDDVVVVHAGALAAYDHLTGELRWIGTTHRGSYSSPHPMTIDGVAQIVMLSGVGATSVAPGDGALLWEHPWAGAPIVQPAMTADGDILIATSSPSGGMGLRRFSVHNGPGGWTTEERWTSIRLKPYFNDFVVHEGHAYGFDGSILAAVDVATGERVWKGGRYGNGQLVLLPEQDLLLVLTESGELALVSATPDGFSELALLPALEGKTWNHPVLVGSLLLVRNGQEMAAFRLPTGDASDEA